MGPKKKKGGGGGEAYAATDTDIMSVAKKSLHQKKLLEDATQER